MPKHLKLPNGQNVSVRGLFRLAGAKFARIKLNNITLLDDELWEVYVEHCKDIRREQENEKQ